MIIIFCLLFSIGRARKNWEEFVRNNSERADPIYRRAQNIAIRNSNENDKGNFLWGVPIAELCGFEQKFGELNAMTLTCSMKNSRTKRHCRATCKNGRYSKTLAWAPMQFRVIIPKKWAFEPANYIPMKKECRWGKPKNLPNSLGLRDMNAVGEAVCNEENGKRPYTLKMDSECQIPLDKKYIIKDPTVILNKTVHLTNDPTNGRHHLHTSYTVSCDNSDTTKVYKPSIDRVTCSCFIKKWHNVKCQWTRASEIKCRSTKPPGVEHKEELLKKEEQLAAGLCNLEEEYGNLPALNVECSNYKQNPYRLQFWRYCDLRCKNGKFGEKIPITLWAYVQKPTDDTLGTCRWEPNREKVEEKIGSFAFYTEILCFAGTQYNWPFETQNEFKERE